MTCASRDGFLSRMTHASIPPDLLPLVMFPRLHMRVLGLARSIEKLQPSDRAGALTIHRSRNPTDPGIPAAWLLWDEWQAGRLLHLWHMTPLVGASPPITT